MLKHSYVSEKVKVASSGINHRGIFAIKPLRKDEVIAVWGGHIITEKEFKSLAKKEFKNIDDYATKIADGFYLVSCKKGGLEDDDFFNHSCSPNAGIKGHVMMVAMRDIGAGEEITYDYVMTDADYDYSFSCFCGSRCCRKKITTNDWQIPRLQRKYRGYFSWYVQEKIKSLRKKK
ncbi:MAG TPA: SET domain-containing methyltransferase [Candidatus Omnitrophota bacterium]|nr:SET domain-containing methyltransferase [Candidatus Omnitrophota bacterium]HPT07107.1 SET domain-containing methyltransferase [Candidatus Omnitrophota bacterium]